MTDLGKLLVPFASTPKDYPESLQKIAAILFYESLLVQIILYYNTSLGSAIDSASQLLGLDQIITSLDPKYSYHTARIIVAVIVAVIIAAFANMIQLHDRISDIFGIRYRFDRHCILYPLAMLTHTTMDSYKLSSVDRNRDTLMHKIFYRYASGRADNPLVDKHDIQQALSAWAWYWVLLEGLPLFAMATLLSLYFGSRGAANFFAVCFLCYVILIGLQHGRLERYARPQVERIAADENAARSVRKEFDAL